MRFSIPLASFFLAIGSLALAQDDSGLKMSAAADLTGQYKVNKDCAAEIGANPAHDF